MILFRIVFVLLINICLLISLSMFLVFLTLICLGRFRFMLELRLSTFCCDVDVLIFELLLGLLLSKIDFTDPILHRFKNK
jgi:hypothetical protein